MRSCPTCGGLTAQPLTPGLWQCGQPQPVTVGGPGLTNLALGPPVVHTTRPCGRVYADTTLDAGLCACGIRAIARCHECSIPVCDQHSSLQRGQRVCHVHRHTQSDRNDAEFRQRRRAWLKLAEEQLQASEPIVAVLRAVRAGLERTWDDDEVARYFAAHAPQPPPDSVRTARKTLFGWKVTQLPAWSFVGGSTRWPEQDKPSWAQPPIWLLAYDDIHVDTTGSIWFDKAGAPLREPRKGDGLSTVALTAMADILKLDPLPPSPKFTAWAGTY